MFVVGWYCAQLEFGERKRQDYTGPSTLHLLMLEGVCLRQYPPMKRAYPRKGSFKRLKKKAALLHTFLHWGCLTMQLRRRAT